jgi:hypothetical protein
MNTEQCRLRVAAIHVLQSRHMPLQFDSPWLGERFQIAGSVLPDEWQFGQSEQIKARYVSWRRHKGALRFK